MSSVDFLAETNACGQTVLKLVSRGNAILAELLRLSEFIPPVFHMATKEERDMYHYILPDFSYFAKQDYYDMAVNTNPVSGACDVMSCVCVVMSCYMSLLSANVLSLHCHVMSCHVCELSCPVTCNCSPNCCQFSEVLNSLLMFFYFEVLLLFSLTLPSAFSLSLLIHHSSPVLHIPLPLPPPPPHLLPPLHFLP